MALRSFILHGVQLGVSNCLSVLKSDEDEIQNPKLLLNEWVLPWIAVSDTSAYTVKGFKESVDYVSAT